MAGKTDAWDLMPDSLKTNWISTVEILVLTVSFNFLLKALVLLVC